MNEKLCQGQRKSTYNDITSCANYGTFHCEDCGKVFCRWHIDRVKHKCDDSVKGCHSIWKSRKNG
jgi:hypothetical protein